MVPRGRVLFSGISGFWVVAGLGRALGLEVVVLTSLGVGASVSTDKRDKTLTAKKERECRELIRKR